MSKPRFTRIGAIATLALGILACGAARGALTYSYVFDQSTYTVTPGGQVSVQVILQETGAPGDVFVLAPGGVGLSSAGVLVTFPGTVATVQSFADIQPNSAFNQPPGEALSTTFATFIASGSTPVTGTMVTPTTYDLLLGTFVFTAASTPGSGTITAPSQAHGAATSTNQSLSIASATATIDVAPAVVAVPEPANVLTVLGGAFAAAGWVGWSWFRRRRRSPCVNGASA
jgi:hypothetical protein